MSALTPLLRTRTTAVWSVLVTATVVSWWLGTDHGLSGTGSHSGASVVVLLVAFFKIRLVGLYFMDLRAAPLILRGLFEGYCATVCVVVLGLYLTS
jgi:hypothetical protein